MLISILIPVYNAEKYLKKTVKSVLNQDYPEIEIILFDDASKDGSREIMQDFSEKYPNKVFSYYTDENGGIGASKNAALNYSTGEYVFFMDCDDYFMEKNYISSMVSQITKDTDIVLSGFRNVDGRGHVNYVKVFKNEKEAFFQSIPLFAKLYRKSFLEKYSIKSPQGVILEDVLYQALLQGADPICKCSTVQGYCWVQNLSSASHAKLKFFSDDPFVKAQEYFIEYEKKNEKIKNKSSYVYGIFLYVCWHLLKLGVNSEAREIRQEADKMLNFMERYEEFRRGIFWQSGSKFIVYFVLRFIYILYRLKLLNVFLSIYAIGGKLFKKMWPQL